MKICILHRHPPDVINNTNPSFGRCCHKLASKKHKVKLVTFLSFNRSNKLLVFFKSLWFVFVTPFKIWHMQKINKFDIIYCDDSMPFYPLFIKYLTGAQVYMRRADLMVDYIHIPFLRSLAFCLEQATYHNVDKISVNTKAFKDYLITKGIDKDKITIIEDGVELGLFKPKEKHSKTFTVMNHGMSMGCKNYNLLFKARRIVKKMSSHITFFFVGNHKKFDTFCDYEEIHNYLMLADVGVIVRRNNMTNQLLPTIALLQYWAMGKPVIVPRLKAISDLVTDEVNGFIYLPDDIDSLVSTIAYAYDKRDELKKMGEAGLKLVKERFDPELLSTQMVEFLT